MAQWRNGAMAQWRNGAMAQRRNGVEPSVVASNDVAYYGL
jgi:hypothetical protein